MLVVPAAVVVRHCDANVLLESDRMYLSLKTMLPPMRLLASGAAVIHVLTTLALGACLRLAYHALARTVRFAQCTLHGLHRLGRRRTQPSIIELAPELEHPVVEQDSSCQLTPRVGSREAWWHHHPDLLRVTIAGDTFP